MPALGAARITQARMNATANNGRKALVYAITPDGQSIVVPETYGTAPAANPPALVGTLPAKPAAKKPAKAITPKVKPAPAKAKGGESKADIALKMLTRKQGATRKQIVEACGGWGIDIAQFAARKGLKMRKDADGVITATAKG